MDGALEKKTVPSGVTESVWFPDPFAISFDEAEQDGS